MKQLKCKVAFVPFPIEDSVYPEVLSPDAGAEILPFWIFRVLWRIDRIGANVTEAAGHSYPVGSDQVLALVVGLICVIAVGVPFFGCSLIEIGVGKEPQSHDSRFISVKRPDRKILAVNCCSA